MKYCPKCGKQVMDEAVICMGCGCKIDSNYTTQQRNVAAQDNEKKFQVSIIFGIVGIVFAWLFALIGHISSIVGIILGIRDSRNTGKATGLVLSIIGEVCAIISSIIGAVLLSGAY